mmetsp:Transcript_16762/g.23314  ORF Transcript_16762/g.23314 Transcript_16762/m.23314 type:complete len:498 (+) Transcript_16762:228-1721(+)
MTSWADELDEEEKQQPQRPSNAWQKGNPWGISAQKKEEPPKSSIVDDSDFPLPGKEKTPREQGASNGKSSNDERRDERREERREERRDDYRRNDRPPREDYRRDDRREDRPPRDEYRREDREDRGERRPYAPRGERREFYGHDDREERRSSEREDDRFGGPRRGGFGKGFNRERREPREQKPREPVPFPTQPPYTAFVGNLPFTVVADDLHQFFTAENCKVAHIRIIAGNDGKLKGYGYVEFEDLDSLKAAVGLNGQPLFERELKIDVAEAKPKQEDRPWKKRDASPPRGESTSPSDAPKERPKIALQPRSEAPKPAAPSDAYKSAKSNPFGEAKPRDENEILKKKEEERKTREASAPKSEESPKSEEKPEGSQEREERKPREEPFRMAPRKEDRPPRRDDRPPRRDDNRRDDNRREDRPPRRDDNRGPRRDDRGPRRDDNRRDDRPPRRDDKPRNNQPNNTTSVPAAKRAPWAPKQEEPKAVQSANIFGLLQEEDL